jgi:hypothetical protein
MFKYLILFFPLSVIIASILTGSSCLFPGKGDLMDTDFEIPRIDKNAPAIYQTATFSLG